MRASWNTDDRHRWDALHEQALGSLQQSWAYGQAMSSLGVPCLRVALTEDGADKSPWLGAAQLIVQRLPWFVRFAYCLGGPMWSPSAGLNLPQQMKALSTLRTTVPLRRPRVTLFAPSVSAAPHPFSGRPRLMSGSSTVILDLTQNPDALRAAQEGRWRNRLHAAERSDLKVRECGAKNSDIQWLIDAEATQRKERRYLTLPVGFVAAFQQASRKPSTALLTLAAEHKHERCAGMMFLLHGRTATYHLGWTNDTGRELSAHNLLLWRACELLGQRGVAQLDLGGVNTVQNPGLARFKIGSGGRVVTWAGTYA